MADSKISQLPVAAGLSGAELVPVVQAGISVRSTVSAVAALVNAAYTAPGVGAVATTVSAKLAQTVSVLDFGADPTNTTDSTAAFANACASLPSGGEVTVPNGTYKVSSLSVPAGVVLRGYGITGTTIVCTGLATNLLTMAAGCGCTDMQLSASVVKTAGSLINVQGNGVLIRRVQFINYYVGITVGVLAGLQPKNTQIRHCIFFLPVIAAGSGGIFAANVSNLVVDSCVMAGPALPGTQPDFGLRIQNGDTAIVSNNNITIHGKALQIDTPAANNLFAARFNNNLFDSAGTNSSGTVASASIEPAGGVFNTLFTNCWFGLSQSKAGCSVLPTGAGTVDGLSFTGCEFIKNGDSGLICGAGVKNWTVTGGGAGGNTNYGYRATAGTTFFTITGVSAGTYSNRGANNYGIVVDGAGSANYTIADNNVQGNTTAGVFDSGAGASAQVYNNNGYNGASNALGITVTASPFTYTAGHTPEDVYVFGGTVSSVTIDGGAQVANATGMHVRLVPNEAMVVTYTVVPTMTKKLS